MPDCKNCSAPLPKAELVCSYCGTRNDIDLRGVHEYTVEDPESERICPRCIKPLRTIDLKIDGRFLIEQCDQCTGMFFDPGELEAVLDKSVSDVYTVNREQIELLIQHKRHDEYGTGYIKCPVCQTLMHRVNFGHRSGVIVDRCREHGVWLDGGELRHLMEWTKSGGQLLHAHKEEEKRQDEAARQARNAREQRSRQARERSHGSSTAGSRLLFTASTRRDADDGLLSLLSRLFG